MFILKRKRYLFNDKYFLLVSSLILFLLFIFILYLYISNTSKSFNVILSKKIIRKKSFINHYKNNNNIQISFQDSNNFYNKGSINNTYQNNVNLKKNNKKNKNKVKLKKNYISLRPGLSDKDIDIMFNNYFGKKELLNDNIQELKLKKTNSILKNNILKKTILKKLKEKKVNNKKNKLNKLKETEESNLNKKNEEIKKTDNNIKKTIQINNNSKIKKTIDSKDSKAININNDSKNTNKIINNLNKDNINVSNVNISNIKTKNLNKINENCNENINTKNILTSNSNINIQNNISDNNEIILNNNNINNFNKSNVNIDESLLYGDEYSYNLNEDIEIKDLIELSEEEKKTIIENNDFIDRVRRIISKFPGKKHKCIIYVKFGFKNIESIDIEGEYIGNAYKAHIISSIQRIEIPNSFKTKNIKLII